MGLCATIETPVKHKSGILTPLVVSTPSYMCGCVVVWVGACVWVFCGCRGVHEWLCGWVLTHQGDFCSPRSGLSQLLRQMVCPLQLCTLGSSNMFPWWREQCGLMLSYLLHTYLSSACVHLSALVNSPSVCTLYQMLIDTSQTVIWNGSSKVPWVVPETACLTLWPLVGAVRVVMWYISRHSCSFSSKWKPGQSSRCVVDAHNGDITNIALCHCPSLWPYISVLVFMSIATSVALRTLKLLICVVMVFASLPLCPFTSLSLLACACEPISRLSSCGHELWYRVYSVIISLSVQC